MLKKLLGVMRHQASHHVQLPEGPMSEPWSTHREAGQGPLEGPGWGGRLLTGLILDRRPHNTHLRAPASEPDGP